MKPGAKITLSENCFKIDGINASGMTEGFEKNGERFYTSIWCDVRLKPFPMLITLHKRPTHYKTSSLVREINLKDYKHKYIAVYDSQYPIKDDERLWDTICHNGLFDIWEPESPHKRFNPPICYSPPEKFRIVLLRIWEIEEEIKEEQIIYTGGNGRFAKMPSGCLKVTLKRPIVKDEKFEEIRNLLKSSIGNYQNQPIREKYVQSSSVERDPDSSRNNKSQVLSEKNFENVVAERIEDIEKGLKLIKRQHSVPPVGRIDLLCEDKNKDLVIIELKKYGAPNYSIIDQIARYMGYIKEHEAKPTQKVRGIIIIGQKNEKLTYAAKAIPNLIVKTFKFMIE
jgi:hypothetical protein